MNVLAVDIDDTSIRMLRSTGIRVEVCDHGGDFDIDDWSDPELYSLLLLNLTDVGGLMVCRTLRKKGNNIPVVGIAPKEDGRMFSDQRATFLENGGDDLLPNPLNARELIASIRGISRRIDNQIASDIFSLEADGNIIDVDLALGNIVINGKSLKMTPAEARLFLMFASKNGRVVTKERILSYLYSDRPNDTPDIKIVDVFVCKLRKVIDVAASGLGPKLIATHWGRGYSFHAKLRVSVKNERAA